MQQFVIEGGHALEGEVVPGGNKNAIIKMLPACLLTDEPVTINNVPRIADVDVTLQLMESLGVNVEWTAPQTLRIHAEQIDSGVLDREMTARTRGSFVFAGPLLGRVGYVELGVPGGDVIGERRLDTHVVALKKLGVEVEYERGLFRMKANRLTGADILLPEASVTATENALMAAVLARGTTIIRNAASEPHVQDLCNMLVAMGSQIEGIGSNRLTVQGVQKLHGAEVRVGADFIEVGSYIGAAVMTGGSIRIKQADPQYLDMTALIFERLGVIWETEGQDVIVPSEQRLTIRQDIGGRIPIIKAQPWPAFPPDLMSIALVVATQSVGAVLLHDWMYESRFFFTDKLVRMGARITLLDPHRVLVQGPTKLKGSLYITSPDIRAGMALVLAALAARGETRISNIGQIDRGYENVEAKLTSLGGHIERISLSEYETAEVRQIQISNEFTAGDT